MTGWPFRAIDSIGTANWLFSEDCATISLGEETLTTNLLSLTTRKPVVLSPSLSEIRPKSRNEIGDAALRSRWRWPGSREFLSVAMSNFPHDAGEPELPRP